jgi:hypothetical protein
VEQAKKMQYKKDKWIETYKKVVEKVAASEPTSGRACAVASVVYLRNALLDDVGDSGDPPATMDEFKQIVRECFDELLKEVNAETKDGFLSNASAAAKAAGYKTAKERVIADVADL